MYDLSEIKKNEELKNNLENKVYNKDSKNLKKTIINKVEDFF